MPLTWARSRRSDDFQCPHDDDAHPVMCPGLHRPPSPSSHTLTDRNKRATPLAEMKPLASCIVEHSAPIKAIRKVGAGRMVMCSWMEEAARFSSRRPPLAGAARRKASAARRLPLEEDAAARCTAASLWRVNLHGSSTTRMGLHVPLPAASSMAAR
ncbi:hypothetical protein Dimus_022556 [Dionaea muscipula]